MNEAGQITQPHLFWNQIIYDAKWCIIFFVNFIMSEENNAKSVR